MKTSLTMRAQEHLLANLLSNFKKESTGQHCICQIGLSDNEPIDNVALEVRKNKLGLVQYISLAFTSTHSEIARVTYNLAPGDFDDFNALRDWVVHTFGIAEIWLKEAWEEYSLDQTLYT